MFIPLLAILLHQSGSPDPMDLSIGEPGKVKVFPGEIRGLARSQPVDADGIALAADGREVRLSRRAARHERPSAPGGTSHPSTRQTGKESGRGPRDAPTAQASRS